MKPMKSNDRNNYNETTYELMCLAYSSCFYKITEILAEESKYHIQPEEAFNRIRECLNDIEEIDRDYRMNRE